MNIWAYTWIYMNIWIYIDIDIDIDRYVWVCVCVCIAKRRNETFPFARTWMELDSMMLSEISQSEKTNNIQ